MPKYKVVGRVQPRLQRKQEVSVVAVQLIEDLLRMERVIDDIEAIDPWNIGDNSKQSNRDLCDLMLRSTALLVRSWYRHARRKLQTEYLAP